MELVYASSNILALVSIVMTRNCHINKNMDNHFKKQKKKLHVASVNADATTEVKFFV